MDSFARRHRPGVDLPLVLQPAVFPRRGAERRLCRLWPKKAEEFLFPVASGIIAGGSLMGVVLIFWENGPQMLRQLLGH